MKILFSLITIVLASHLSAQPEPLDNTFNDSGKVYTKFDQFSRSKKIVVQPDGRILFLGQTGNPSNYVIARYLSDGALDPSFGDSGVVVEDMNNGIPNSIHLFSNGKILIGGQANYDSHSISDYALIQLLPNGSLDTTFGRGGKVTGRLDSTRQNLITTVMASDLRIIVIGQYFGPSYPDTMMRGFLMRFHLDGSLDTTFGNKGASTFDFQNNGGHILDAVLLPDSRIAAVCSEDDGEKDSRLHVRFFGWNGNYESSIEPRGEQFFHANYGASICKTADNKLIIAGPARRPNPINMLVAVKLTGDGWRDISFNFGPSLIGGGYIHDVAVTESKDGSIYITGEAAYESGGNTNVLFLIKCLPDGSRDTSFGNRGVLLPAPVGGDIAEYSAAIAADSNNRILVAGVFSTNFLYDQRTIVIKRYIDHPVANVDIGTDVSSLAVHPHPVSNKLTLGYRIERAEAVSCLLYDMEGRLIRTLFTGHRTAGSHTELITITDPIRPGAYFLHLLTRTVKQTASLIFK